jgi:hypothetical protein
VVLAVLSVVLGCGGGDTQHLDTRQQEIIGGWNPIFPLDGPMSRRFVKVRNICSGTVIREKWVITAKHCVDTTAPYGWNDVEYSDGSRVPGDAIVHPTLDVALIKLHSPTRCAYAITDSSKDGCHKVPLFMYNNRDLDGKEVVCFGYGHNKTGKSWEGFGTGYGVLRGATLMAHYLDEDHLIYYPNSSGQIQASGDSGSSCFYKETLIDITSEGKWRVSWGGDIELLDTRSVSASGFRDWVLNQIGESPARLGTQNYIVGLGAGVYSVGNDQKIQRRVWNGSWSLSDWRYFSFSHPEVRWNNTVPGTEYYSLKLDEPKIHVSNGWNSGIVPTKFFDTSPLPTHYSGYSLPVSSPAVVERPDARETHMFWQTDLGALGHMWRDDTKGGLSTGWTSPDSSLGSGFPGCTSQPAAVVDVGAGSIIHLFVRGTTGELLYNKSADGKTWGTWNNGFRGYLSSAPGAAQMNNGVIYIAARGGGRSPDKNGGIWYTRYDSRTGAVSYGWKYLAGTEFATSGPGVLSFGNRAHIYYLNELGQVCQINEATAEKEDWVGPFCPII